MSFEYLYPELETDIDDESSASTIYCTECCDYVELDECGSKLCPCEDNHQSFEDEHGVQELNFH